MIDIVLVAAVAENGVIGRGGMLPWRLKSEMQHFRALTWGRPVIAGRKTYLSFSRRPLAGRTNIVVSRDENFSAAGAIVVPGLAQALQVARADALRRGIDEIMVVGGSEIYVRAMPVAKRMEITYVHMRPPGDAVFPTIDPAVWLETARSSHPVGIGDDSAYDCVTYRRVEPPRP